VTGLLFCPRRWGSVRLNNLPKMEIRESMSKIFDIFCLWSRIVDSIAVGNYR